MDGGYRGGGSLELARLIDVAGDQLIPDLAQYYGIDARDLFRDPPLSPRFVLMHVANLPVESSFMADQRGGQQFRGWDEGRYMLASVYNVANILRYVTSVVNSDPDAPQIPLPTPYPLPDRVTARKVDMDEPGSFGFVAKMLLARAAKRKGGG